MAPLRIAQLANFIGPTSGGMRRAVDMLGHGYLAAGHERLLIIPGHVDHAFEADEGIVVQVKAPRVTGGYRIIMNPNDVLAVLDRFRPTSVEVSDKWTLTPVAGWARRRGVGSILFSHERLDDMASMFVRRRFGIRSGVLRLNKFLARRYDRIVVTSQYSSGEWSDTEADLEFVPLGVDLDTFSPRSTPADDGVLKLVYVGRMSREKSPQLGVAAVVELHRRGVPVHLRMYGTGPHLQELKALAAGSPITFEGYLDGRDEVAAVYGSADISLSVCPAETFGLAVLEALASGTPVVTSDRGGARELVDDTCSEWDEPTATGIADAIERLAGRVRADEAGMRAAARTRAERYPWSATIDQMIGLHTRIGAEPTGRPRVSERLRSFKAMEDR